jgi:hypothetical protein
MFIGHIAVAFAAKKVAPKTSLGTLLLSAQFVDLLFPLFFILGIEHMRIDPGNTAVTPMDFYDYPFSHSLLTGIGWAILLGGMYYGIRKRKPGAYAVGFCVISHWILDFISHRADMPLAPGLNTFVGLGLWNSVSGTLFVEGSLFASAIMLYIHTTAAKDRIGKYSLWSFVIFLVLLWIGNIFGPPPPNLDSFKYVGFSGSLLVVWAYWIDKHRRTLDLVAIKSD